jgi:hypothetical protein
MPSNFCAGARSRKLTFNDARGVLSRVGQKENRLHGGPNPAVVFSILKTKLRNSDLLRIWKVQSGFLSKHRWPLVCFIQEHRTFPRTLDLRSCSLDAL